MTEVINISVSLDYIYEKDMYTIVGAGGNIIEWTKGYNKLLAENNIGQVDKFYRFTGRDMNEHYNLVGDVAYPNDLTFLAFNHDNLDVAKLAVFKLQMQDRWFRDIVDNNNRHLRRIIN